MFKAPNDSIPVPAFHEQIAANAFNIHNTPVVHISLAQRLLKQRSPRLQLTVATLCVLSGAILLVVVFIMSWGLSSASLQATVAPTRPIALVPTAAASHATPAPASSAPLATSAVQPTSTPTPGNVGQQYIDNAQMTSAVNFSTAQPLQVTTQFYRNQKIYVTFALHPGRSGAACLLWYLNNQQFTNYTFPVANASISAYSYAISGIPGAGYVEIYWASSTTCTDKILAQKVSFIVI